MDSEELGRGRMDVGEPVGAPGSATDKSNQPSRYVHITPARALLATLAAAAGLCIGYFAGIAIIDAFERLLYLGTVLGANPFGWSL